MLHFINSSSTLIYSSFFFLNWNLLILLYLCSSFSWCLCSLTIALHRVCHIPKIDEIDLNLESFLHFIHNQLLCFGPYLRYIRDLYEYTWGCFCLINWLCPNSESLYSTKILLILSSSTLISVIKFLYAWFLLHPFASPTWTTWSSSFYESSRVSSMLFLLFSSTLWSARELLWPGK